MASIEDELEYRGETKERNLVVASFLTFLHPALGFLYVGQARAAAVAAVLYLVMLVLFVALWGTLKFFPVMPLFVFATAIVVFSTLALRDVSRQAMALGRYYVLRGYNHPVVYIVVFLMCALVPTYTAYHTSLQHLWGIVKVNDTSMVPTVDAGEVLLFDRVAFWAGEPEAGDMVVLGASAGGTATRVRLGRVIAVPGDKVKETGTHLVVNDVPLKWNLYGSEDARPQVYLETNREASYLIAGAMTAPPATEEREFTVSDDDLVILSDNRAFADQRAKLYTASKHQVLGKPRYLLYSTSLDSGRPVTRWERVGLKIR